VAPHPAILTVCLLAATPQLPRGWKAATLAKKSHCGGVTKDTDLRTARGDFDADGNEDVALLLESTSGRTFGVWVWFAGKEVPILVVEFEAEAEARPDLGISVARAIGSA
jgi:hypothetical protein